MKSWRITAAAIVFLLGWSAVGQESVDVDARADRLSVDHQAGTAVFEGNVRLERDQMTLTCQQLRVTYDKAGNITSMEAHGAVVVRTADGEARAGRAQLDVAANRLVLTEKPRIKREGGSLTGRRIEVDLDRAVLRVIDARGTFRFGTVR